MKQTNKTEAETEANTVPCLPRSTPLPLCWRILQCVWNFTFPLWALVSVHTHTENFPHSSGRFLERCRAPHVAAECRGKHRRSRRPWSNAYHWKQGEEPSTATRLCHDYKFYLDLQQYLQHKEQVRIGRKDIRGTLRLWITSVGFRTSHWDNKPLDEICSGERNSI